ncbi:FAD/NAD(P)-binding domain-containing protein [Lentinus tigrinus ALCF2SS1-6]|uniref:FAD/NAD(P)-binding domain-containing protein n=1 Tax=Lentinus tigrinus ALCF2SS1-6 TaxID=1328759 RepID=A0A5C2SCJ3_9APHY|nr:FAD/NAD(P)-binding domain-containing protein [Lentinus tigrinus ALCF2SS1-6]
METFDCVVVGAGWFGLAAAKTYIQLHPDENVLVLESEETLGGVWSQGRLYPGLHSNNMLGNYEFPDFAMDEATFGVKPGQHIPGAVVHQYLTKYAEHFGVYRRIRFSTRVEAAEENTDPERGGWVLSVHSLGTGERARIDARRLIVATGLTSEANLPEFAGRESFGRPLFHIKDFARRADLLKTARTVSILGGAKSAWDAAYAFASSGVPVDLVIRKSGRGPMWMSPPYVTPLKKLLEQLVHTRFLTWFSPCVWGDEDGYGGIRRFLHGTWLGRKIVDAFWTVLGNDVLTLIRFDDHPETAKLRPWNSPFWTGSALSILNFPTDFFELVRNGTIRVHIADITHLSEETVHLSTGEAIKADALLCATGWKARPPIDFLPPGTAAKLGLPHYSPQPDALALKADSVVLERFPRLKDQPTVAPSLRAEGKSPTAANQPFRLYRFMVPPSTLHTHNIAFAGMLTSVGTSMCASAQALWISAYLDGALDRLASSAEDARWEATLHAQFERWRYPCGFGARLPDFVFDAVPYVDMLMRDLGLEAHRKGSVFKELFEPYGPQDYENLPGEWARQHGRDVQMQAQM